MTHNQFIITVKLHLPLCCPMQAAVYPAISWSHSPAQLRLELFVGANLGKCLASGCRSRDDREVSALNNNPAEKHNITTCHDTVSECRYLDILCLHPLRATQCQGVTCDPGQLSSSLETAALGAGAGEAGRRQVGNGSAPSVTIRKHFKRKENIYICR